MHNKGRLGIVAAVVFAFGAAAVAAPLEIRSGDSILGLDAATGALVRLAAAATGLEAAGEGGELFHLIVIPPGGDPEKPVELSSKAAEVVAPVEGDGLSLRFERIGGRDLTAVCRVEGGADGFFRFRIRVEGEAGTMVERIDYPHLPLAAPLDGDGAGDALVFGTTKGGVVERPHELKPGKYIMGGSQPGSLAAQFGCYYGSGGGVVTYCEDSAGYPKTLSSTRTSGGVAVTWRHSMLHDLKEPVALAFPVVVGLFRAPTGGTADWRDAAKIYKAWALKQPWCAKRLSERSDLPDWLKQGPAQVRFSRNWLGQPERIEAWLEKYWSEHFKGVPLIVTFWGWEGVATWAPPQYFPPYPSEEGLKRCVDAVKRAGGHAFFWPSGYQWCLTYGKRDDGTFEWEDLERYEREAKPHAMVSRDGKVMLTHPRWYRGGEAATLCRGDKWSRDWFTGIAAGLAERGGELFQIDQVVGAAMRGKGDCRATTHGHPAGMGLWDTEAAHLQMTEMLAACRAVGVNMVLGFEEPQELFLQEVGIQDYRDYEIAWRTRTPGLRPESVFGYVYHEFVPIFQSNPRGTDRNMTAHCIVTGQMPHLVPNWPLEPYTLPANGGFEEWRNDVPVSWEHVRGWKEQVFAGKPQQDQEVRHSGTSSLRVESTEDGQITQVSRNLPIGVHDLRVGGTYRLSAWCRTERLDKPAAIGIAALTPDLKGRGSWKLPFPEPGDWQEVSTDIVIPGEGADKVRVMINVEGPCRVWVDDFRILEIDAQGTVKPIVHDALPSQHDLYKQWVPLYHGEGRPYLALGEAIPPPAVEPADTVKVGAFRAADKSEAVILVNPTDAPQEVTLRWRNESKRLQLAASEVTLLHW